ncbi:MAG: chromosome segregation protein SMC [candidate division Zixibacteria bacterium]|nr:chromosome segregation protein SMC [candidate division Zixibacteria bacterium]
MYLKQLEILGFKSFPNKTVVKFSEGVTAIVGPNGCGKTNILDALRWVLGEQRPTLLRGGKMEEVIFNGTREMKPLGMAEVTLTVVNDRGVLPTEYHEVQITRRLFRSDESEYLLNKIPCRLKDITELFVDTGMGAHSYSVIQQDMIESVISDKAEERRFLFEEAAGITKYKHRKRAALRKLEATENDFLRLKDIHSEVKTRVNSLHRQQKKAERYSEVRNEIKDWELYFATQRVHSLDKEKRELKGSSKQLSDQKLGRATALDSAAASLGGDRQSLSEIERQLTEVGQFIYSASESAHSLEQRIAVLRTRTAHANEIIEKNTADINTAAVRVATLSDQLAVSDTELATQSEEVTILAAQLAEAETSQAESDRRMHSARSSKETDNQQLIELEGKLSSGKTEESSLKEQEDELKRLASELTARLAEGNPLRQDILSHVDQDQKRLNELQSQRAEIEQTQTFLTETMERLVEHGNELTMEASNLTASLEACQARRTLLEEMMLHYEGYESGLVVAMQNRGRWPAIAGTVAEHFVPVAGMDVALETALGEISQFLICQEKSAAEAIISFLKTEKKGKIGILVPNTGVINSAVKRPEIHVDGVIGWLDSFVTAPDYLKTLKDAVLSRILVFREGTNPESILPHLPYGFTAVSTDGILYGNNLITGGSDDHFPLFRRREKVQEQEEFITQFTSQLADIREKKNREAVTLAGARAQSGTLTADNESIQEEIDAVQHKLNEHGFEQRSLTAEVERLEKELVGVKDKLTRIQNRQYSLGLDFTQLSDQKDNLLQNIKMAGTRLEDVEKAASDALERVAKLQVLHIEAKSRLQQTESRMKHVQEIKTELEQTRLVKEREIAQLLEEIAVGTKTNTELETELKASFEHREAYTAKQNEYRQQQSSFAERLSTQERTIRNLREEQDTLGEQLHQIEIRLNTNESETRGITEKLRDDYYIDIRTIESRRPESELTDETAKANLVDLKEKLKSFGAVNLLALDEYQEASEREKFLDEQIRDLTTAKNNLQTTITKINQTAKQLFNETLDKVQVNFRALFVELFNGGEAEIRLENPEDPLESNIEIIARPHGKKLLPITMMSGGERALTAISLLFSLYLVKPSPFCILDEIDAPLDDANCRRFLTIIRKFSSQTQFITITHNKITMETADNLYGITMEQPGVSKLVAVKFAETESEDGQPNTVRTVIESDPQNFENRLWKRTRSVADDNGEPVPESIQDRLKPSVKTPSGDHES